MCFWTFECVSLLCHMFHLYGECNINVDRMQIKYKYIYYIYI